MNKQQKIERWAKGAIKRNISQIILPDDADGFIAFGRYHIQPQCGSFLVTKNNNKIHYFSSKRSAISWCVADHYGRQQLAKTLLILDQKKQTLGADVACRRAVIDRSRNVEFRETVQMKIQPKIDALNQLNIELEKCINSAKYLQIKGFSNETARTSRA